MPLLLPLLTGIASAWQPPNSTVGGSVGIPWTFGGRGEIWFADELSIEAGAGVNEEVDPVGVDFSARWHPDPLCILCDRRAMVTFAVGVSSPIEDFGFDGPWRWAIGPDLAATFVYWFSPAYGLAVSANGGAGPSFVGTDLSADGAVQPWVFGTVGLAF